MMKIVLEQLKGKPFDICFVYIIANYDIIIITCVRTPQRHSCLYKHD